MKILVTGASGFVGRPLCGRLAGEGNEVIAATRSSMAFGTSVRNVVVGDLTRMNQWPMLDGCDAVVHLAAHVHRLKLDADDRRLFREVNVDATARLVHESRARGVRRFVFLSTVKVHGETSGERPLHETSPIAPGDAYASSKAEAEVVVRSSDVPHVILRPPLVYGPQVGANFRRLIEAVARGWPIPLAKVENRRSLLYVGNLVDAIVRSLESDLEGNHTFLLRDGDDVSSPDLVAKIATALEVKARLFAVPVKLLGLGGGLLGRADAVRRLTTSLFVDDSAIRRDLGWTPPYSLDQGLQETMRWFRDEVAS